MDAIVNLKSVNEDKFEVEYEVIPFDNITQAAEERKKVIRQGIEDIDDALDVLNDQLDRLNTEIDRLTNHADGIDYMVAVGSGIIAGIIDILFVEDFSLEKANKWGDKKTNNFIIKVAQQQGYQGNELYGAVKYLEEKYPIAADKATNYFGGGMQHHLRDFSHHPTPIGLIFSLLTQFTHKVYGTDVSGKFMMVELKGSDLILVGKNFPEKITFGMINWFFHMISDMAGSSGSILIGKTGTGLPGPIVSLLKEVSVLPIFKSMNDQGYKEFSVWISKLFNGTLLGERDENGKLLKPIKFDLRTEIGVAHQLQQQAIPVIVNECIVRGFYFIRRLLKELKASEIHNVKALRNVNWKNTLPFKNRTIIRMLTISSGTMAAIDFAGAAMKSVVKSGGITSPAFLHNMIINVNFVGVGRFAIAVSSDMVMGIKKKKVKNEYSKMVSQVIRLSKAKLYYKNAEVICEYIKLYGQEEDMIRAEANLWLEVQKTEQSMCQLYEQIERVGMYYLKAIGVMNDSFNEIELVLPRVEEKNPGLIDEMLRRLRE